VRERVVVGDDVVIGRGSLVENDTTIGARTKIQAGAYITAYCELEDDVFIAPCVVTTNDNFMGRTERRHALVKGATIRRGARVGGGAILLPAVEIGEEAFVGAGAVVIRDVPARKLVVGVPAKVVRDAVPEDERWTVDAARHYQELSREYREAPEPRARETTDAASARSRT
jgi:acetyltransferase-like isoleucine patch superfamily enzyme